MGVLRRGRSVHTVLRTRLVCGRHPREVGDGSVGGVTQSSLSRGAAALRGTGSSPADAPPCNNVRGYSLGREAPCQAGAVDHFYQTIWRKTRRQPGREWLSPQEAGDSEVGHTTRLVFVELSMRSQIVDRPSPCSARGKTQVLPSPPTLSPLTFGVHALICRTVVFKVWSPGRPCQHPLGTLQTLGGPHGDLVPQPLQAEKFSVENTGRGPRHVPRRKSHSEVDAGSHPVWGGVVAPRTR